MLLEKHLLFAKNRRNEHVSTGESDSLFFPKVFSVDQKSANKNIFRAVSNESPKGSKMKLVWEFLHSAMDEVDVATLKKETSATSEVLRRLQDNGFITSMENHFPRNN